MDLPSDSIDLLAGLAGEQVESLLVGGLAAALHGRPRFAKDAGVWLRDTPDNIGRARRALDAFGAPAARRDGLTAARGLDVVWMGHPPSRIDRMKAVPGGDFERAWSSRRTVESAGVRITVVGREELIRSKRQSGRPQDLLDAGNPERRAGS